MSSINRCKLHVFGDVYVTVCDYKNQTYVHIRFHENERIPTKKGVCLTLQRWKRFTQIIPDILSKRENAEDDTFHLGNNQYVTISSNLQGVDVRDFWSPEGDLNIRPTRRGVFFKDNQLKCLVDLIETVNNCIPELDDINLCLHDSQPQSLKCPTCNPNEYHLWAY